jgi:hypothetical protein
MADAQALKDDAVRVLIKPQLRSCGSRFLRLWCRNILPCELKAAVKVSQEEE